MAAIFDFFKMVLYNTNDITEHVHSYLYFKKCPIMDFRTKNCQICF